ncbi:MAG: YkgJ family cysteine cluster protein [Bdellovibrionales bacterium]
MSPTLVPNRECGSCNYCCQYLVIDCAELQLTPGQLCHNWKQDKGCTIYDTRPATCRGYMCGWRLLEHFDAGWQPDRCGMIITPLKENMPEGYQPEGIEFYIVKPELALAKPEFVTFMVGAIEKKIPLYISWRGPPGVYPGRAFLNGILEDPVLRRDHATFMLIFNALIERLRNFNFRKVEFKNGGSGLGIRDSGVGIQGSEKKES